MSIPHVGWRGPLTIQVIVVLLLVDGPHVLRVLRGGIRATSQEIAQSQHIIDTTGQQLLHAVLVHHVVEHGPDNRIVHQGRVILHDLVGRDGHQGSEAWIADGIQVGR